MEGGGDASIPRSYGRFEVEGELTGKHGEGYPRKVSEEQPPGHYDHRAASPIYLVLGFKSKSPPTRFWRPIKSPMSRSDNPAGSTMFLRAARQTGVTTFQYLPSLKRHGVDNGSFF
jgi:hypothetical protein